MNLALEISTRNFSEATKINGNDEFCFIIGNQKLYCHKFVAAFISPNVCKMLLSDPTINLFHIQITPNQEQEQKFNQKLVLHLTKLIQGEPIEINQSDFKEMETELDQIFNQSKETEIKNTQIYKYTNFLEILGNNELKDQLYSQFLNVFNKEIEQSEGDENQKSSIEQKVKHLLKLESIEKVLHIQKVNENEIEKNDKFNFKNYFHQGYEEIINEIASHFYEIDEKIIENLSSELFEDILKSTSLLIQNEDKLLQIILDRKSENDDDFLQYIRFEYLSQEGIENFLNKVDLDEISVATWERIKKRLVLPVQNKIKNDRENEKIFSCEGQNNFDGIFKHLTTLTNGNIHENKTIEITASNLCNGDIKNLVDFNSNTAIRVGANPCPRWIKIDFKNNQVSLNSYLIKARDEWNCRFIKSWKIEISNNGNDWEMVDEQNNVAELNGDHKKKLFKVNETKKFRFIRIITSKENHTNNEGFSIGKLELFGKLFSNK